MSKTYQDYLGTYAGKELLSKHKLDEKGFWAVHGEDANCDMGGPHIEPYLCTIDGTLEEAIKEGVKMDRFWQWGGGGSFRLITPVKPGSAAAKIKRLREVETQIKLLTEERDNLRNS